MARSKRLELAELMERNDLQSSSNDLFTTLVASQIGAEAENALKAANKREKVVGLTEREVMGNICMPACLHARILMSFALIHPAHSHLHRVRYVTVPS